jgi:hypothetical protein
MVLDMIVRYIEVSTKNEDVSGHTSKEVGSRVATGSLGIIHT